MSDRVNIITPTGEMANVDAKDVDKLPLGARVATEAEIAKARLDEAYAGKSGLEKATSLASVIGPVPFALRAGVKIAQGRGAEIAPTLPPTVEAYAQGVSKGYAAGLPTAALHEAVKLAGGAEAAKAYAQTVADVDKAYPGAEGAGELAGFLAPTPIGKVGGVTEHVAGAGLTRVLGPVAERTVLARALGTAGELGARGAVEGALYGGGQQITEAQLGDHELAADKLFAHVGIGAMAGAGAGAVLGGAGSLAASGVRRGGSALMRVVRPAEDAAADRAAGRVSIETDAGLREAAPEAERAFEIGAEKQGVGLRPNVYQRGGAPKASRQAFDFDTRTRQFPEPGHGLPETTFQINPDAGLSVPMRAQAERESQDVFRMLKGKREVSLGSGGDVVEVGGAPLKIGEVERAASPLERVIGGGRAQRVANELAVDALSATKAEGVKALEHVPGGRQALGEWLNREILHTEEPSALKSTWEAFIGGRADDLLPKIQAAKSKIGAEIGDALAATPSRIGVAELEKSARSIAEAMTRDPTRIGSADAFAASVQQAFTALRNARKIGSDGTIDTAAMFYERANMERAAYAIHAHTPAADAWKEWLRDVDAKLVDRAEQASKEAGKTSAKDAIVAAKRRYQLASVAEEMAEKGSQRVLGNNIVGLREGVGLAVGLATGHAAGSIAATLAFRAARQRGPAAAAALLTKLSDMGAIAKLVRAADEQIGKASRGLLAAPAKRPAPVLSTDPVRARAARAVALAAEVQADPMAHADRAARDVGPIAQHAPNIAGELQQRQISAAAFFASKIPVQPDHDPLDPHPAPRMTDAQAAELVRYWEYVERPMRFFEDLERGKITYEGAEVARELMPKAFEQLRAQTLENLATLRAKGTLVPYNQRRQLGIILDAPTTPDQRPDHARFLQANVMPTPQEQAKIQGDAPSPPKRPVPVKTQQSALDRLAAK